MQLNADDFSQMAEIMADIDQHEPEEANKSIADNSSVTEEPLLENSDASENDSDFIWIGLDGEKFPKPKQMCGNGLFKRDDDDISGILPYAERVSFS